jgi:hypothetical protein
VENVASGLLFVAHLPPNAVRARFLDNPFARVSQVLRCAEYPFCAQSRCFWGKKHVEFPSLPTVKMKNRMKALSWHFHFTKWTSRAKFLFCSGLLVAVSLALILGIVFGLRQRHSSSTASTPSTPPSTITSNVWQPPVNSSWQIVLLQPLSLDHSAQGITPDVDVFDIDLFTNSDTTIQTLHRLKKMVICYFSAGSYEPNRPDSNKFDGDDLGHQLDGWPGERWLNTRSSTVRSIMNARIQLASQKGCDGIDPDNVDGYVSLSSCSNLCSSLERSPPYHINLATLDQPNSRAKIN